MGCKIYVHSVYLDFRSFLGPRTGLATKVQRHKVTLINSVLIELLSVIVASWQKSFSIVFQVKIN